MTSIPEEYSAADLAHLIGHHGLSAPKPMAEAPRDGTMVVIVELTVSNFGEADARLEARGTLARVVQSWVTDEFIPSAIADDDSSGMNHGALPEHVCFGWLPPPKSWPVKGDPRNADADPE